MKNKLFTEKYRPTSIEDCILTDENRKIFNQWIEDKFIPNTLFVGHHGIGKTTVAKCLVKAVNGDVMEINGSMKGNIDTLRNEIQTFASSVSFSGSRKYVLIDEGDYLNPNSTQPALRNFMEEFSKNCGFIITGNYENKIIPALRSRCNEINFTFSKKDSPAIAKQFLNRLKHILQSENIQAPDNVLIQLIFNHFPDFRRTINECQKYASNGKIDSGILDGIVDQDISALLEILKKKQFTEMRKWVAMNAIELHVLIKRLYEMLPKKVSDMCLPEVILVMNKYQYQESFVINSEINCVAMLTELMKIINWK